jgi:hypothetical protein
MTPRYRDWLPENRTVTVAEWVEYIGYLVGFALQLADADVDRWATLAAAVGTLPPADSDRVLAALEGFADPALLDDEQRVILWERLHTEVNHHRRFSSATWAMRDELLVRLQAIADRIEPLTNIERFGYLFDWHPDLPEVDMGDFETYQARLHELRTEAVTLTLKTSGIQGVRELAGRSPVASQLGFTVGEVASDSVTGELLTWLDSNEPNLAEVARAWAARKLDGDDTGSRLREMLSRPEMRCLGRDCRNGSGSQRQLLARYAGMALAAHRCTPGGSRVAFPRSTLGGSRRARRRPAPTRIATHSDHARARETSPGQCDDCRPKVGSQPVSWLRSRPRIGLS